MGLSATVSGVIGDQVRLIGDEMGLLATVHQWVWVWNRREWLSALVVGAIANGS